MISFWLRGKDYILEEGREVKAVRDAKSAVARILLLKHTKSGFSVTTDHAVLRPLYMCLLFSM